MAVRLSDVYFYFENMPVRIVATRKIPSIETPGIDIPETNPGKELTVNLWIALEFIEAGLAKLVDEGVTEEEWTQIHYRERFQPLGRPAPLPENFYAKAYLTFMREISRAQGDAAREDGLGRLKGRFRDILESRIGKITRLAAAEVPAQTQDLQPEEEALYRDVFEMISEWRKSMKKLGEE
jgi:hypothetical protein